MPAKAPEESKAAPAGVVWTPEVKVNADEARTFGLAGPGQSVTKLQELHKALYPKALRAAMSLKADVARTEEILRHLEKVESKLRLKDLVGLGVRGVADASRVVTITTRKESGRIHHSFIAYRDFAKHAPDVHKAVERAAALADAKARGLPWSPQD